MSTRPNPPPTMYLQERQTMPPMAILATILIVTGFFLGPLQLLGVIFYGEEPVWLQASLWGAAMGTVVAAIIGLSSHSTVVTITDHAIVTSARTIPLDTITRWTRLKGKALYKARFRLGSEQGAPHPITMGIWMLRGGRNKLFAPPWMSTAFLIEGPYGPVALIGTRNPEQFLAALETATSTARTKALRDDGRPIRNEPPPEIRDAARGLVDDLMPPPSPNGQVHGRRRGSHDHTT